MELNRIISFDDVIVQRKGLDSVDMDGETVMMNINKGKYYGLNTVASRIWELIEKPCEVKEVISILLKEFNVDSKTCENTVLSFVDGLYHEELITIN